MTNGIIKNVFVLAGPTGLANGEFETVNIYATGPTGIANGTFEVCNQATGPTGSSGPTGTFKTVIDAGATGLKGYKSIIIPGYSRSGSGGFTGTTFNPATKASAQVLSNGNLTLSATTGGHQVCWTTTGQSAGKFYFEMTANTSVANDADGVGIGNSSTQQNFLGLDLNSIGYFNDGRVLLNGGTFGSNLAPWQTGNVIGVAVDYTAKLIWFRVDAGGWNDDVIANQNPALGIGGRSLATLNAGPYFPAADTDTSVTVFTLNSGSSAFANTIPVGFTGYPGP
jgi:hypothetical protein